MPLLNYTSKTPAHQSIAEISRILSKAGARQVMHDYDDAGNIVALSFSLELEGQRIAFRLPSDWHPVQKLLIEAKKKNPNMRPWQTTEEHARDVAWRIIKDWVEAQMAIIETRMVTTAQVFLPYAVTKDGQTVYEYIAGHTQLL
ncbi:MAG TPA: hypothetical protein VIZ18_11095, partial [Ktedonobacteraceae bacterium]